jgi:hypothetical protein
MKLKELKRIIDESVKKAEDCNPDVEIWFNKSMYRIGRISQFSVVPVLTIEIGEKVIDYNDS